jgi:hypothetical protein
MTIRLFITVILLCFGGLLSGCDQLGAQSLTKEEAAKLVLRYTTEHCPASTIWFNEAKDFSLLDGWVLGLTKNGYTRTAREKGGGPGIGDIWEVYRYDDHGVSLSFTYNYFNQAWYKARSFNVCLVLPSNVEVLDISMGPDKKSATVIYRYTGKRPSGFSTEFTKKYTTKDFRAEVERMNALASWKQERRIVLQRLDATGWRVAEQRRF